jgi:hypothetical protein
MTSETIMIHTHGKIQKNDSSLAESFKHFGFNISHYSNEIISDFLNAKINKIKNEEHIHGKTQVTINILKGTIDHGQNKYANNKKIRTEIQDYISNLSHLDLSGIQDSLKNFLSENFQYDIENMVFKIDFIKGVINVRTRSSILKEKQMIEHNFKAALFNSQKLIIEHVYKIRELNKITKKIRESKNAELKTLQTQAKDKINVFIQSHESALSELRGRLKKEEKQFKSDIESNVQSVVEAFNLKNK